MIDSDKGIPLQVDAATFSDFIPEYVSNAVEFVYNSMKNLTENYDLGDIRIERSPFGHPKHCPQSDGTSLIFIDDDGNDEFQWIYQFAHELTHAYIKSRPVGEKVGLWWFEEIICCLSSLYHLAVYDSASDGIPLRSLLSAELRSTQYLSSLQDMTKNLGLLSTDIYDRYPWTVRLTESRAGYDGGQYNYFQAVAFDILPFFLRNPRLWKIIRCMWSIRFHHSLASFLNGCQYCFGASWYLDFMNLKNHLLRRTAGFINFA